MNSVLGRGRFEVPDLRGLKERGNKQERGNREEGLREKQRYAASGCLCISKGSRGSLRFPGRVSWAEF